MDLEQSIKDTYTGMNDVVNQVVEILTMSPESNASIWGMIKTVFDILLPIGFSIATIFILISFVSNAMVFKLNSYEHIVKLFLIFFIGKMILENSFELMGFLYQQVADMIAAIGMAPTDTAAMEGIDKLINEANELSVIDKILFRAQLIPISLIMMLVKIFAIALAYGRLIEIYIYLAVAPIPIATAVSEEYNHIAKKFFQNYIGVCLQGLIMLLVCTLYSALSVQLVNPTFEMSFMGGGIGFLLSSIVLIFALLKSGSWAKAITGLV